MFVFLRSPKHNYIGFIFENYIEWSTLNQRFILKPRFCFERRYFDCPDDDAISSFDGRKEEEIIVDFS